MIAFRHKSNNAISLLFLFCSHTDLAEVQSVASAPPMQVGTKKIDERAFFDVSWDQMTA